MPKKIMHRLLCIFFVATSLSLNAAQKPPDLSIEVKEDTLTPQQHNYHHALTTMISVAKLYLESQATECKHGMQYAVIFDIDGTLIKDSLDWKDECGQAIPEMREFFDYVKKLNVFTIYLMTARSQNEEIETRSELAQAGICGFKECIFMPFNSALTAGQWKAMIRGNLQRNEKIYIVATFDDNEEVMDYGALGEGFLVPRINPLPDIDEDDLDWAIDC